MSENTASAQSALLKEKKSLDPRIAFALMLIMLVAALLMGANKAWTRNRTSVDSAYASWQENVQQRIETAYNILTVSGRYFPETDGRVAKVRADLKAMEDASLVLDARVAACERFSADATALLDGLAAEPAVQGDSRDRMYATLMLPQAVEQCSNSAALQAYQTAAESYNDAMHSFSGILARITGVEYAQTINAATAVTAAVEAAPDEMEK